jgi:hypothetical protein
MRVYLDGAKATFHWPHPRREGWTGERLRLVRRLDSEAERTRMEKVGGGLRSEPLTPSGSRSRRAYAHAWGGGTAPSPILCESH